MDPNSPGSIVLGKRVGTVMAECYPTAWRRLVPGKEGLLLSEKTIFCDFNNDGNMFNDGVYNLLAAEVADWLDRNAQEEEKYVLKFGMTRSQALMRISRCPLPGSEILEEPPSSSLCGCFF
jgi:hypothetical protein